MMAALPPLLRLGLVPPPRRRHDPDRVNAARGVGERLGSLLESLAGAARGRASNLALPPLRDEEGSGGTAGAIRSAIREPRAWIDAVDPRHLVELWRNWEMVMGPELASLAFPLGRRREILIVGGEDNIVLQELSFQTPEILERVNAFMDAPLDAPVFARVELRLLMGQRPLSLPPEDPQPCRERPAPARPADLGAYFSSMRPDSPVARAYAACLRMHGLLGGPEPLGVSLPQNPSAGE